MNAEEIAQKFAEIDQRSLSNSQRLGELAENVRGIAGKVDALNKLAISIERLVIENQHQTEAIREVKSDVSSLSGKVEAIEQKPAKKWDSLAEKVLWALVAAVLTFALTRIGLAT